MARKKTYDEKDALAAIKDQFWRHGYEGASLHALENATGLPKQTLYREFGSKKGMYLAALADYERDEVRGAIRLLRAHDRPEDRVRALFDAVLEEAEGSVAGRGCFLCNAAADRTGLDEAISHSVSGTLSLLRDAMEEALDCGPADKHRADALLASYIGFRNLARNGWPVERLRAMATNLAATAGNAGAS